MPKTDALIESKGKNFELQLDARAQIVFGDENSLSFKPCVRYSAFGNDGSGLVFRTPTSKSITPVLDKGVVGWDDAANNIGTRFYQHEQNGRYERGAMEYEVILYDVPPSPDIPFQVELSGLTLHPQGPLTDFEIDRGNFRPLDMIGGFAVYHSTKRALHSIPGDADIYKVGKAFDLPLPAALDALGNPSPLGSWKLDAFGNITHIRMNPDWILNAKYPVVIDPTIGFTALGASTDGTNKFALGNLYTVGAGTLTLVTAYYGGRHSSTTAPVYIGVYDEGDGNISANNRLAVSSAITLDTTAAFRTAAITGTLTASTNVFIEGYSNTAGVEMRYDATGGQTNQYTDTGAVPTPPDPHATRGGTQANFQPSVYVEGDAAGGGPVIPVFMNQYRQRKN